MTKYTNLVKRFGVLAVLVFCLGFVLVSGTTQNTSARPCCSSCAVYPGDDEITYCENLCITGDRGCFNRCVTSIHNCWRVCSFGC
jgi:hypothetical protein